MGFGNGERCATARVTRGADSLSRHDSVLYNDIVRNYLFELDQWTVPEELGIFEPAPPSDGAPPEPPVKYKYEFAVDAFFFGNFTRFCNHRCNLPNAGPRAVYIEDVDPRRPLWVFFALADILVSFPPRLPSWISFSHSA